MRNRYVLLPIILFAIATFGPVVGQDSVRKESVMIDSFGRIPNGDLRARLDHFLTNMMNQPDALGVVHVFGTPAELAARKRLIHNHIRFRAFDPVRVSFKNGRNVGSFRTDLWLVPAGAAPPEIKPEAWIVGDFGQMYKKNADKRIKTFFEEYRKHPDHQAYIISYGSPQQIAIRERWIRDSVPFRTYDALRITLVNGGSGPVRTVMWLVPPGAENPTP